MGIHEGEGEALVAAGLLERVEAHHAHALHRRLAATLQGRLDLIDLAAMPDLLESAYWQLDGHLNETGNARVADLLARRLAE